MGLTEAILVPPEKELLSKFLFIILHKCESTMLADSFTNFGGIVSGPVAFLMFMFYSNLLMSDTSALGIIIFLSISLFCVEENLCLSNLLMDLNDLVS